MARFQSSMPSLTIMVIWHQWMVPVTSVSYKTLFDRSCGTLRQVFFVVDARWNSNPLYKCSSRISQWEVSRLSPQLKNSEPAISTQYELQPPRLLFLGVCAKSRFSRKNLTRSTHCCNGWKVSPKGSRQQTISRVSKNVLKVATLCLEVTIF